MEECPRCVLNSKMHIETPMCPDRGSHVTDGKQDRSTLKFSFRGDYLSFDGDLQQFIRPKKIHDWYNVDQINSCRSIRRCSKASRDGL